MKTVTEFQGVTVRKAFEANKNQAGEENVAASCSLTGDRLARLMDVLPKIKNAAQVKRIRVFAEAPNVKHETIGEFFFVIDRIPKAAPNAQNRAQRGRNKGKGGGGRQKDRKPGDKKKGDSKRGLRPNRNGRGAGGKTTPSTGTGWSLERTGRPADNKNTKAKKKPSAKPRNKTPEVQVEFKLATTSADKPKPKRKRKRPAKKKPEKTVEVPKPQEKVAVRRIVKGPEPATETDNTE